MNLYYRDGRHAVAYAVILGILTTGCRSSSPPVQPQERVQPRMVLDVRCAAGPQTDTVEIRADGYDYSLVEGRRDPGRKVWRDERELRVTFTGFRPDSTYMIALGAYGEETAAPLQRVTAAGRTVRDTWQGDLLRIYFSGTFVPKGTIDIVLEPQLSTAMLTHMHIVENPVSFPAGSVNLETCAAREQLTVDTALRAFVPGGPVTVTVDAQQRQRRFNRVWEGVNGQSSRSADLGVRTVWLDGADLFAGAFPASGVYRWARVDTLIEQAIESGAEPVVSMTSIPEWLWPEGVPEVEVHGPGVSSRPLGSIMPPRDPGAWAELVYQTVRHLNFERGYGIRHFEVWRDPADARFWRGSMEQYLQLYETTVRAVKRADRAVQVGGPAAGGYETSWIETIINFAADKRVPLDFLSWHCYATNPALFGRQVAHARQLARNAGFRPSPTLIVSEWGYGSPYEEPGKLDSPFAASYSAAVICEMEQAGLDRAYYSAIMDDPESGVGSGLVRTDLTPKPVYALFKMMNFFGTHELGCRFSGAEYGIGVLAGEGLAPDELAVIVWWWIDGDPAATGSVPVRFAIENLSQDKTYGWEMYVIDDKNSNFAAGLHRAELSLVSTGYVPAGENRFELYTSLPLYGVQMIRLVPEE